MRILVATETYPNPYRPYLDYQLAQFIRDGHELGIIASQAWPLINPIIDDFALASRTRYFPQSLREAPRFLHTMISGTPRLLRRSLRATAHTGGTTRDRLSAVSKMLTVPGDVPDVVLVHDFWLLNSLRFLRFFYRGAVIALYHHGGESSTMRAVPDARPAFDAADVVFTNTEFSRRELIARGCPGEKVVVVPVGFDAAEYTPTLPKALRPEGTLRLIFAGRLVAEKGLSYVFSALATLRAQSRLQYVLTVMGDGPVLPDLQQQVDELGLTDQVSFLDNRPSREMIRTMDQHDALVLTSYPTEYWNETQGCVVQEALLMRLMVVTTTTGGLPESIPNAMRQFAVPCHDSAAIASALERIAVMDDATLGQLGDSGRQFALENYGVRLTNQRLLDRCRDSRLRPS